MILKIYSIGSADTERLGELVSKFLTGGEVIELYADLGGGKTTFVRGLARGLGSKDRVSSPTFTLSKIYRSKNAEIHHYDFYRLAEPGIMSAELAESLRNPKVITIMEWSNIVKNVLPTESLSIEFKMTPNNSDERQIIINFPLSKSELVQKLETAWQEMHP